MVGESLLEAEIHVVASIPDDSSLRQAWLEGAPLHSATAEAEAAKLVRALEKARERFADDPADRPASEPAPK